MPFATAFSRATEDPLQGWRAYPLGDSSPSRAAFHLEHERVLDRVRAGLFFGFASLAVTALPLRHPGAA